MTPKADIPDHNVIVWLWSGFTCNPFGLASLQYRKFCLFTQPNSSKWTSTEIIKWRISGCLFTTVTKLLTKCTSWSKITVQKFLYNVSLWVWKCKIELSIRRSDLLYMLRGNECLLADRLEAATYNGSYSFSVFQCQLSVCLRVCLLLQKQWFETSVVIMNGSMSPSVEILSV